jgi:hypothetical protein
MPRTMQNSPFYFSILILFLFSCPLYNHSEITGSFPVLKGGLMDPGYCIER